ncbi:MAG: UvrD-helicase domain-containing protein, partial [Candidatus Krumholzibacteriota bacterium]|nr:UvrD-helicase domain-containing protein [Candidatus Krumholzibacteriota bacterium]
GFRAWVSAIIAVARAYEDELRMRNLIDFSDMITVPARGLRDNAGLRERFANRFDHILVDEFQDTSAAQNELIRILSGGDFSRVTVVGDDKQSIYRWRDARVENIREFPNIAGAHGDHHVARAGLARHERRDLIEARNMNCISAAVTDPLDQVAGKARTRQPIAGARRSDEVEAHFVQRPRDRQDERFVVVVDAEI